MDLLTCIAGVLGKGVDHNSLLGLARALNEDPSDTTTGSIFHDAMQDADLFHPKVFSNGGSPVWHGLWNAVGPEGHEEVRQANRHLMNQRLEPVRQRIESAADNYVAAARPHQDAVQIALEHGDRALANSHTYAMEHGIRPAEMVDDSWGWHYRGSNHVSRSNVPRQLLDRMPNEDETGLYQTARYYPTQRQAWDAFHQAHADWFQMPDHEVNLE